MHIDENNIQEFMASMMEVPKEEVKMGIDMDNITSVLIVKTDDGWRAQVDCDRVKMQAKDKNILLKGKRSFPLSIEDVKNFVNKLS